MEGPPWVCNSDWRLCNLISSAVLKALGTWGYLGSSLSLSLAHFHSLTHSLIRLFSHFILLFSHTYQSHSH